MIHLCVYIIIQLQFLLLLLIMAYYLEVQTFDFVLNSLIMILLLKIMFTTHFREFFCCIQCFINLIHSTFMAIHSNLMYLTLFIID